MLEEPSLYLSLYFKSRHEEHGAVREVTGKRRYKVFAYQPHLDILSEGTQPL